MKLKNYTFFVLLIVVGLLNVSLAHAQNMVDTINQLKTELYLQTPTDDPLSVIDSFESKYSQSYKSWSDEDKLIFDNTLVWEKAYFLPKEDAKEVYILLQGQDFSCEEFFKGKKLKDVDSMFLISWADIKSLLIPFLSGMDLYEESMKAKDLYNDALKKDKKFSPALRSYALWLFFAPPIAGGGYDSALKQMSLAVQYAQTDIELFLAFCYRSQVFFAMGREEESLEDLEKAYSLFPDEILTSIMREANANDKNFF